MARAWCGCVRASRGSAVGLTLALALGATAARATPPDAEPRPLPRLYVGVRGGVNLVLGHWDVDAVDAGGIDHSAETSPVVHLHLGVDVATWLSLEVDAALLPLSAGGTSTTELGAGVTARIPFSRGSFSPYALIGAGGFVNPDGYRGADWDPEGHYGLGATLALADWLDLRVEARHVMSDGLDATLSHALEITAGLDVQIWRAAGAPEERVEPPIVIEPPVVVEPPVEPPVVVAPPVEPPVVVAPPVEPPVVVVPPVVSPADPFADKLGPFPFDVSSAELRPELLRALDALAATLAANPTARIRVEGHADTSGSHDYNERLSLERATRIRDLLVQRGVAAARMDVRGFGDGHPVADNSSPEGRAKNRRVEIRVLGQ